MYILFASLAFALLHGLGPSPVHASPWTLPQGGLYAYGGFFWTQSQHFFNTDAERTEFLNNGTSQVHGLVLEGAYGVTRRLMFSGSLPVLWYELRDIYIRDAGRSLGDVRVAARLRVMDKPFATAVEAGVKFPTAEIKNPSRAQVGEGQYDLELVGSMGKQVPFTGLRISLDAGYRWRRRNPDTGFKPGDEFIYRVEMGYELTRRFVVNTLVDGFEGGGWNTRAFGLSVPAARTARQLVVLVPGLTYHLNWEVELHLSATLPLAGRQSYAGNLLLLGISYNRSRLYKVAGPGGIPSPRGSGCCRVQ